VALAAGFLLLAIDLYFRDWVYFFHKHFFFAAEVAAKKAGTTLQSASAFSSAKGRLWNQIC
jgi:hypothetical protein